MRISRDCTNGNHSDCTATSCACSHHKTQPSRDYSGACYERDHDACQMGTECACPHHTTDLRMVTCAHVYCSAHFFYVPERDYPELCLDHADEVSRQTGWSPTNSVD